MGEEKKNYSHRKELASVETYDMIGFDVDHCLVRYKYKEFLKISIESMKELLIRFKDYDAKDFEKVEENLGFGMKNLIIDLVRATKNIKKNN